MFLIFNYNFKTNTMKKILDNRELISLGIILIGFIALVIHNCIVYGYHNPIAS